SGSNRCRARNAKSDRVLPGVSSHAARSTRKYLWSGPARLDIYRAEEYLHRVKRDLQIPRNRLASRWSDFREQAQHRSRRKLIAMLDNRLWARRFSIFLRH